MMLKAGTTTKGIRQSKSVRRAPESRIVQAQSLK
jgi:hypothetical protein